jgi:cell division protein FtsQ
MAKSERELMHQQYEAELGRARKRKLKRQNLDVTSTQSEHPPRLGRPGWQRASSRGGPSPREGLVAGQIRVKADDLSSLKVKLSSRLSPDSQASKPSVPRRARRRAGESRSASLVEATSRAETQRMNSPEKGYVPLKNRRVYDARTEAEPPVMVRGGMGGMAFGRVAQSHLQKSRTPRRRIDLPLRVPGAEVRLPAIPLVHLGWRAVSLLMVLLMSASLVLMWKAPIFMVGNAEASGLKRLTVSDLNAVMGTYGKSVFTLNPGSLREALRQAFPEFSKVSVRVNLPSRVKVVVTERQPVISWTQDGVESWVDAQGVSFPPRGAPKNPLVQVEGYGTPASDTTAGITDDKNGVTSAILPSQNPSKPALQLSHELVSAILALGAKMPAETVLVYDSQRGLGWNDPIGGWDVFFGNEDQDMDMKLAIYQALVERLNSEGIKPALISVEYVHAPYYRMQR